MKTVFGQMSLKVGLKLGVSAFFAFALVLSFAPRALNHTKAESCSPVYTSPIFNPYPVSFADNTGFDCTDAPVLAGNVQGAGTWSDSFQAGASDNISMKIYVHNGAATGSGQVMHNVHVETTITDTPDGTSHTITTTLTASNAPSKTGFVVIQTPAGSHLTGLDGMSFDIGDLDPCFDFAQIFRFTIQVSAPAPVAAPSGQISASVGNIVSTSPCLETGGVTWTTQNVSAAQVTVNDLNDTMGEALFAGANSATNQPTPWLKSGHQYLFILYNTSNGSHTELARTTETVPAFSCQPAPTPSGEISATVGNIVTTSPCLETGGVSWTTQNVTAAQVTVTDLNNSLGEQLFAGANSATNQPTPWLKSGHQYLFILYNTSNGSHTELARTTETVPAFSCAPSTFTATASATATATANASCPNGTNATASATASATATGTSTISQQDAQNIANNSAQQKAYAQALANAQAAATANCPSAPANFTASATATAAGNATVNCPFGGSATATASATASATANSTVSQQDAQNKAQSLAQSNAQAQANANAQAAATAKCPSAPVCVVNSNFALNAATPAKNGSTFSTTVTWSSTGNNQIRITQINPGSGEVTIVSNGANSGSTQVANLQPGVTYIFKMYDINATCGQFLTSTQASIPAAPQTLICFADNSLYNIGDTVVFRATGGNGNYIWTNGGSPSTGNGTPFNTTYSTSGTKTVGVLSNDGQTASCSVVINAAVQTSSGNCNNDSNSCNTNTNTNTDSITNSTNSSNQNNNTNINGDNNTVTNTNNNCVNNSCNVVYINQAGNTVAANNFAQLSITKNVRNSFGGAYQNSISANNNDTVQFEIVVTNTGSATANNVRLTDNLPSGLTLVNGSVQINGSQASDNTLFNNAFLGNLTNGQQSRINFQARVNANGNTTIQNTASAISDNAGTVQASAWVFVNGSVQGASVNLAYSKRAFNETKNADAQSVNATKEDFITYTLTVTNNGNTPANNFVITDDLSQVLPYADITDNGGGNLNGNVINYPGITVPAGGSVSRSFKVRVKFSLADNLSYIMTNTYGNTVTIRINPQVLGAFIAPKTGADTMAFGFSGLLTAAAAIFRKRKSLMKLIFT